MKGIIAEQLTVDSEKIMLEADFRKDYGIDSLDIVELIMAFEEEFDGKISDDEVQKIRTVADAVQYVERRMMPKG